MENTYSCKIIKGQPEFTAIVPGSKSIMNRALLLAALSEGETVLFGTLYSSDSKVFIKALKTLGYHVKTDEKNHSTTIGGCMDVKSSCYKVINVGNAGTAARFLTAMLALSGGRFEMHCLEQMKRRPMRPLLESLECLGARISYLEEDYCFPFRIESYEETSVREVTLNIDQSSQFLSALLMASAISNHGCRIRLTGKRVAKAYVSITKSMMKSFGVECFELSENLYEVPNGQKYERKEYHIEPDVSAACYFYALAALTGGRGTVKNVSKKTLQGDIQFVSLLERMGCMIEESREGLCVIGPRRGTMQGVTVDMSDFSDQTMTLAAMAPFLCGKTIICNVGHIRLQESDRLRAISTELAKLGVKVIEKEDGLEIFPKNIMSNALKPVRIQTYEDHRMAMAFALIGCMVEGIEIDNPMCCKKTFEDYFQILEMVDQS